MGHGISALTISYWRSDERWAAILLLAIVVGLNLALIFVNLLQNLTMGMANQLDDALAGGASLEEAAKKLGLAVQTVPAVTRDGLDAAGKPLADLTSAPQLLPTAFGTDAGQTSPQIEDGAGGYFVLRVDQITPPALRPFDQVKDKVLADWTADAQSKAAADEAAKIV